MESYIDFATFTKWSAIATAIFFILSLIAFLVRWGTRFRLIGATGFMLVLTFGLFGLSLGLFKNVEVPGSVPFSVVYDNGGSSTVISVPGDVSASQLEATLKQAANRLFSYGRISGQSELVIRARTLIHPEPGISQPIYLGQIKKAPFSKEIQVEVFQDHLKKLN